jgi:hypothetical protein
VVSTAGKIGKSHGTIIVLGRPKSSFRFFHEMSQETQMNFLANAIFEREFEFLAQPLVSYESLPSLSRCFMKDGSISRSQKEIL